MEDKEILTEVTKYLDYLETPSDNFSGMAVCPFLKKERITEALMLKIWRPNEQSFFSVLDEFVESDKSSALLVCMDSDGLMWEEVNRKKYQIAIQLAMKEKGYKKHKALCFSPHEDYSAAGEQTRKKSPYFLINIAEKDALDEAHRSLWKTKYFDNFTEEEQKRLKVFPKKKKVLHLILMKEPFDKILNGTKTIEYRDKTDYWKTRLENKKFNLVKFRNGYQKDARVMLVEHKGMDITDRYEIKLGKIIRKENIDGSNQSKSIIRD